MSVDVELDLKHLESILSQVNRAQNMSVKVGVLAGATYPNGTPVSQVAKYLEYGWTQSVSKKQSGWFMSQGIYNIKEGTTLSSPARPFFSMTANANRERWQKLGAFALRGLTKDNVLNKITQALQLLGATAQQDIQDAVMNGGVGGTQFARRSPLTLLLYGKLLEGRKHRTDGTPNQIGTDKPLYKTGHLASSIAYELTND